MLLATPLLTAVAAGATAAAGRRSDAARYMEALDHPDGPTTLRARHVGLVARLLHACAIGDGAAGLDAAQGLDRPDVDPGLQVFVQIRRA